MSMLSTVVHVTKKNCKIRNSKQQTQRQIAKISAKGIYPSHASYSINETLISFCHYFLSGLPLLTTDQCSCSSSGGGGNHFTISLLRDAMPAIKKSTSDRCYIVDLFALFCTFLVSISSYNLDAVNTEQRLFRHRQLLQSIL